ncbi:MAG: HEAT repeat domain-containing protein [Nitrospirae bacterium]|nr:HEAT repeat domain-containing protein [Nitrospirota bacterium]
MDDVEEKDLVFINDIFLSMTKTLKTFKAYLPNNPIYQKFATGLLEKFDSYFEAHDSLPVTVEQFSLLYAGKEVFHSEERTDNIALMLFVDGIREICFYKGITLNELISFVDVFKVVSESQNFDDDIVTLLWERNIGHITYSVSEGYIEEELSVADEVLMGEGDDERTPLGTTYIDAVLVPSQLDFNVDPVISTELETLQQEAHRLERDNLLFEATELFLDLMTAEKDIESFRGFARNIEKIIDIVMDRNSIEKSMKILGKLRMALESETTPEHKEIINAVIDKAGAEDKIKKLFAGDKNPETIQSYLLFLNKNAIPVLLTFLGELEDRKMRKSLCNILSIIGKQDIEAFAKGIYDDRWYLVRNTLMILGMIKDTAAIKYIEGAMSHPELRVRKEALRALESIGSDEIKKPLMTALNDSDPGVRTGALKILRRFSDKKVFELMKERVLAGDLKERPFTEKKEIFEAFAETGKEAVFPILSEFFRKKGFLRKTETAELRACAAYGLGILGTKESVALLEKGVHEKEGLVSDACKKALKKAKAG